jgi:hypothetical protein
MPALLTEGRPMLLRLVLALAALTAALLAGHPAAAWSDVDLDRGWSVWVNNSGMCVLGRAWEGPWYAGFSLVEATGPDQGELRAAIVGAPLTHDVGIDGVVTLRIDQVPPWPMLATTFDPHGFGGAILIDDWMTFFDRFAAGRVLTITLPKGMSQRFSLDGSRRAVEMYKQCLAEHSDTRADQFDSEGTGSDQFGGQPDS